MFILALFFSLVAQASVSAQLRPLAVNEAMVRIDLALILKVANFPNELLGVEWKDGQSNSVRLDCQKKPWMLQVSSSKEEKSETIPQL